MFSIGELETLTGVNRRNIRFYVEQEVIPPPDGAGLGARYDDEHLLRLRAIPILRNRGMRLDEIRAFLGKAKKRDVEQLVAAPQPQPAAPQTAPRMQASGRACIHYVVAPGVEITVDVDAPADVRANAAALIAEAGRLFGDDKGEGR